MGKLLLMFQFPSGSCTASGTRLVKVVDSRHFHIALVAEIVAFAVLQRQHGLFVIQMDQVLHVVFLAHAACSPKKELRKIPLHTS